MVVHNPFTIANTLLFITCFSLAEHILLFIFVHVSVVVYSTQYQCRFQFLFTSHCLYIHPNDSAVYS